MADSPNPIQLQKFLGGVDYPADKSTLVSTAEKAGADQEVMDALNGLPERRYEGPTEVSEAVAGGS